MSNMQEHRIEMALPTPAKLLTRGVVAMITLMILGYALMSYFPDVVAGTLALSPRAFIHGKIWQLLTYSFVSDGASLIWNGMVVLFMGSAIEREWRTKSFLLMCLTVAGVCGIMWLGAAMFLSIIANSRLADFLPAAAQSMLQGFVRGGCVGYGMNAVACGIIAAFGVVFRGKRFFWFLWTIEAQNLAILFIAINLIIGIRFPVFWIWVAGAGVGYLYIQILWKARSFFPSRRAAAPETSRFKDL